MAALKINPDNSVTVPIPLLAILVTLLLAAAGWANSLRQDVGTLVAWRAEHEKSAAEKFIGLQTENAKTAAAAADYYARSTAQNAAIQETLTSVRIQIAARR